jgi:cell division protein FtsL
MQEGIEMPKGVPWSLVSMTALSITVFLLLTSFKIFLSSKIYYESKKVNNLRQDVTVLKAENIMLQNKVEALRFKNRVTDPLFVMDQEGALD